MTDTLRLRLTGDQKKRLARPVTRAVDAYQAFLKGRFLMNKRAPQSFADALKHFEEAIERDPDFAAAHAAFGEIYALSVTLGFGLTARTDAIERARAAAGRALALDDALPEAHALAAYIKFRFDWDWRGAETEFKRALDLNPGHAPSRHAYALFLGSRGRHDEALREMQQARELDPLSLVVAIGVGRTLHLAGRFEEALAQYRQGMVMDPSFTRVHFDIGLTLIAMGAYDEAVEAVKKFSTGPGGRPFGLVLTTIAHARAGRLEAARALIAPLEQRHRDGAMGNDELTMIYAVVGESRKAADVLVRACEERATALSYAGVEPALAFLRNDPECRPILKREGLLLQLADA